MSLPWNERVTTFQVNPASASLAHIMRLAEEWGEQQQRIKELEEVKHDFEAIASTALEMCSRNPEAPGVWTGTVSERVRTLFALLEQRIKELVGAEREGPTRYCIDCGRAMVWTSERGEAWMCPYDVWWRMERAEEQLRSEEYVRSRRAAEGGGDE